MPARVPTYARIGVAVLVALMVAAAIGAASGARNGNRQADRTTTTSQPKLAGAAGELLRLLQKKDGATYHARYTGSSPEAQGLVLETWQDPPLVRQDSQVTVGAQAAHTESLVLKDRVVRCTMIGTNPWECRSAPPGTVADPLSSIRARLGQGRVDGRTTHRQGREVRCYRFTVEGAANELCVLPDSGIPVVVRAGGSELTLDALDRTVDKAVFEPPAPVTDG